MEVSKLKGKCSKRLVRCVQYESDKCVGCIDTHEVDIEVIKENMDQAVKYFLEDLVETLTIRCPRPTCRVLLDLNPDACAAITCGNCGQHFCGCCYATFSSSQQAHLHVPLAHNWRDVYLPREQITQGQRAIRLVQLQDLLASIGCVEIVTDILQAARESLKHHDMPEDWATIQLESEQARHLLQQQRFGGHTHENDHRDINQHAVGRSPEQERGDAILAMCHAHRFDMVRVLAEGYVRDNAVAEIDWFARAPNGNTAFNAAARLMDNFQSIGAMQLLISLGAGVTINIPDCDGLPALHRHVMLNDIASVKFLLQQEGIDVECTTAEGRTALFVCAEMRLLHIARELLRRGAYVHTSAHDGTTLLMALSLRCQADKVTTGELARNVQFWLDAGVDVEAADGQSAWRALHYAAAGRYDKGAAVVRVLLRARADVTATTRFAQTPLKLAVCFGNTAAIPVLVEAEGAEPSISVNSTEPLLLNAAVEPRRAEITKVLKDAQGWMQWKLRWRRWLQLDNSTVQWLVIGGVGAAIGVMAVRQLSSRHV